MKLYNMAILIICLLIHISCEEPDDPVIPYSPEGLKLAGKSITSLDIVWGEASIDDFDRYEIYCKVFYEEQYKLYLTVTSKQQIYTSISGLTPNTGYNVIIKTISKTGDAFSSPSMLFYTFNDVPSSFTEFRLVDYSYSDAQITWSKYQDSYAVPFARYEIHAGKKVDFVPNDSTLRGQIFDENTVEYKVLNLQDKSKYYFKIRVYNKLGNFSESPAVSVTTLDAPPQPVVLSEPMDMNENGATLEWSKSDDGEFTNYNIYLSNLPEFTSSSKNLYKRITDRNATKEVIAGLNPKKVYFARVSVVDKYSSVSRSSNVVGFNTTKGGSPVPCEIGINDDATYDSTAAIGWASYDSLYFGRYDLHVSKDISKIYDKSSVIATLFKYNQNTYLLTRLEKNTEYFMAVRLFDVLGKDSFSKVVSIKTKP